MSIEKSTLGKKVTQEELAQYIDHTVLKANVQKQDIEKLCQEAIKYNFKAVCINPLYVNHAKQLLSSSDVAVCTVVGFPLGANATEVKALETEQAIKDGADEIDMVIAIGQLLAGDEQYVEQDVRAVVTVAKKHDKLVKVIIETAELTEEQIVTACQLAVNAGADYIKTSTGFASAGATVAHVKLMAETVQGRALVKASGGVKDLATAQKMIEAGASRIGTSSGVAICGDID